MNSNFRTYVAAILACAYLIISFIPSHADGNTLKIKSSDKQNACFTEASVNFLNAAQRSENVFSSLNTFFTSDFKNSSKEAGFVHHALENLADAAFRFYCSSPLNSLFRFYLTDIIFPFHFFW